MAYAYSEDIILSSKVTFLGVKRELVDIMLHG